MSDELASKLDDLIALGERIASALEGMESDLASIASDASTMQLDVSTTDGYALR